MRGQNDGRMYKFATLINLNIVNVSKTTKRNMLHLLSVFCLDFCHVWSNGRPQFGPVQMFDARQYV